LPFDDSRVQHSPSSADLHLISGASVCWLLFGSRRLLQVLWHIEVEHGFRCIPEHGGHRHADHECLDAPCRVHVQPDTLAPSIRVRILEEATKNSMHDRRSSVQRGVGICIIDWQDLRCASELDTPWRGWNQRPRYCDVYGNVWVTSYVASFRGLGTRWNIDVKAPSEIAHASNVGAT